MKANEIKVHTKAEQVAQEYDDAAWDGYHSEGCYRLAIATAHELGGVEVYNANDVGGAWSYVPTRTFEFDDGSCAEVTYGSVFVE